ncbi:CU044_5270 family protein [Nonomuraea sediminis]|uniref:CU044_5270 family protein n=1 Tax=Nonomuraea sediminis TaxID=2835864 RepID=UPI001BDC09C8|nr:CU044_5270 family protein [Nonomuraea sediminis]
MLAKPAPSPDVVTRRRRQLRNSMGQRPFRRKAPWILVPAAVAAVAAGLVIAPGRFGNAPPPMTSARDVLLVAATTAARTHEEPGKYWHVTVTQNGQQREEYWYQRDGQLWIKGEGLKGEGKLTKLISKPEPFAIGPLRMTFDELRQLPADENALYTQLRSAVADSHLRTSAGPLSDAQEDGAATETLISLISEAPVSPEVRAGAYRALAARPGVQDLGDADGGRRLQVQVTDGTDTIVVDPNTAHVHNTSSWVPLTGGIMSSDGNVTIDTEWTDDLPAE